MCVVTKPQWNDKTKYMAKKAGLKRRHLKTLCIVPNYSFDNFLPTFIVKGNIPLLKTQQRKARVIDRRPESWFFLLENILSRPCGHLSQAVEEI